MNFTRLPIYIFFLAFHLLISKNLQAEVVRVSSSGKGEFQGFRFEAIIGNFQTPEPGKSRLLKFRADYERAKGSFHQSFQLTELDVLRFSAGIVRHRFTASDGYPAFIISVMRRDLGENPILHPRTGGEITNDLIARIIIYPQREEVQFKTNYEDGNSPDGYAPMGFKKVRRPRLREPLEFTAAELSIEDPMKVERCVEWIEHLGHPNGGPETERYIRRNW